MLPGHYLLHHSGPVPQNPLVLQQSPKPDPVHEISSAHFPSMLILIVVLSGRPVSFGGTGLAGVGSTGVGPSALRVGSAVAESS